MRLSLFVLVILLDFSSSLTIKQPSNEGQGGAPFPYGGTLNVDGGSITLPDNTNTTIHTTEITPTPTPPFQTVQANLRCTTWPSDSFGSPLSCASSCREVCEGLTTCPCDEQHPETGCWIPKYLAKVYCDKIDGCKTISNYIGKPSNGLDYFQSWSYLGSLPVVKKTDWTTSVCETATKTGCYKCSSKCKSEEGYDLKRRCFAESYNINTFYPDRAFCLRGAPNKGPCSEASTISSSPCCTFQDNSHCDLLTGECLPNRSTCSADVVQSISATKNESCTRFLADVQSLQNPKLKDTCDCLTKLKTLVNFSLPEYDCAIVSNTKTLREFSERCQENVICSESDECKGCNSYQTAPDFAWNPVENNPLNYKCAWESNERQCQVTSPNGEFLKDSTCSTNQNILKPVVDWYREEVHPFTKTYATSFSKHHVQLEELQMAIRKNPVASTKIAISPKPQPSVNTEPVPVNFEITNIGHGIEARHYVDDENRTINVVMSCTQFPNIGRVHSWSIYAGRKGRLHVQVLRQVDIPNKVSDNPATVTAYQVIGENVLYVPSIGNHTFDVPPEKQIEVAKGDVIGFYSVSGIVSWNEGGETVLWRYGRPTTPTDAFPVMLETKLNSDHLIFVGNGVSRTYSIFAKGSFPGYYVPITPSNSPSPTISFSSSVSPSKSSSSSPSRTSAPSSTATPTSTSACGEGQSYWCQDFEKGVFCGISEILWRRVCHPSEEETSTPTPTPDLCDYSMKCPEGFVARSEQVYVPCFMPSRDCVPCNGTQCKTLTSESCTYCNQGDDWEGLCLTGREQSPVKIEWDNVIVGDTDLFYFSTNYTRNVDATLVHTGDGLTIYGNFGEAIIDGVEYVSNSIVIHSPAEHFIDKIIRPAIEFQVFHHLKNGNSSLPENTKVVVVFFDEDTVTNSLEVAKIFGRTLPSKKSETVKIPLLDLNEIIDDSKPMLFYNGSLTLPPCTEHISYAIQMGENSRVSHEIVAQLDSLFKKNMKFAKGRGNVRKIQSMNDRKFVLKANCGKNGAIACPRPTIGEAEDN